MPGIAHRRASGARRSGCTCALPTRFPLARSLSSATDLVSLLRLLLLRLCPSSTARHSLALRSFRVLGLLVRFSLGCVKMRSLARWSSLAPRLQQLSPIPRIQRAPLSSDEKHQPEKAGFDPTSAQRLIHALQSMKPPTSGVDAADENGSAVRLLT